MFSRLGFASCRMLFACRLTDSAWPHFMPAERSWGYLSNMRSASSVFDAAVLIYAEF